MSFFKKFLKDFSFVILYYIIYYFLGIDFVIIIGISQIISIVSEINIPKREMNNNSFVKSNTKQTVYLPQKRKIRF